MNQPSTIPRSMVLPLSSILGATRSQLELVAEREPVQGLSVTALAGLNAKSAAGETLTAPKVDGVNTLRHRPPWYQSAFQQGRMWHSISEARTQINHYDIGRAITQCISSEDADDKS